MPQCKWCDRSGIFLSLDDNGLCNNCQTIINNEISQRMRIISESLKLVNESKNIETRISRCDLIINHIAELLKYENKNLSFIQPVPSVLLKQLNEMRENIIINTIKDDAKNIKIKVETQITINQKISILIKFLSKLNEYKILLKNQEIITEFERQTKRYIHKIKLTGYLEEAKKFEFKNLNKKALDQYYEALYFVKNDDIDDSLQVESIEFIENKIKLLSDKH